jgi:hypothetical protein
MTKLFDINPNYELVKDFTQSNQAAIGIIYNKTILGKVKNNNSEVHDIAYNGKLFSGGRPLLIAITDKNNLLINVHGNQKPPLMNDLEKDINERINDFNNDQELSNKNFIEDKVNNFLKNKNITQINEIIITGDFNDRYDAIKDFTIAGKTVTQAKPVQACCYNYDSSDIKKSEGSKFNERQWNESKEDFAAKKPLPEEETISHYLNYGDKVYGLNPVGVSEIYKFNELKDEASNRSDHELVFAVLNSDNLNIPQQGGRRKTRKRSCRKHRRTCKKARKHRAHRK